MKKDSANSLLNDSIERMELKRAQELIQLKQDVNEARAGLTPLKLIKNTLIAVSPAKDFKAGIGTTVIGLASGFIIKKILFRNTYNPIKLAAGYAMQTAVVVLVTNNSDKINSVGKRVLRSIMSKLRR